MGLHLRGNVEGFTQAASEHKWLRIDSGTHHGPFYSEEGRADQLRFFDHWLKGKTTPDCSTNRASNCASVTAATRTTFWRVENEWPLARTQWTNATICTPAMPTPAAMPTAALATAMPAAASELTYWSNGMGRPGLGAGNWVDIMIGRTGPRTGVSFETPPLDQPLEVTGPITLTLWAASETEDMDVLRDDPQHRCRRQRRARGRSARTARARCQGLAARIAPKARSATFTLRSPLPRARSRPPAHAG